MRAYSINAYVQCYISEMDHEGGSGYSFVLEQSFAPTAKMDLYHNGVVLLDCEHFYILRTVAAVVGVLYLLKVFLRELWTLGGGFCAFFLAPWGISRTNLRKYGEWAVVTGASEGIGKGYALELARQGLNVVIMSRSREKLEKVADEIKSKYSREVKVVAVDFSDGQDVYPQIAEKLKDLEIGVLVNNVGLSYEFPDYFADVPELRLQKIIELNCQALVQMTRLLLPKMVERKSGVVVNISSAAATGPLQYLTVYSASKVFVNYFSDALRKEYTSKGIEIQTVMPFFVATAMSGIQRTSFMVPNGNQFAHSAVATIGIQKTTFGCLSHAIQAYIVSMLPSPVVNHMTSNRMLAVRAKFLRRKSKQK